MTAINGMRGGAFYQNRSIPSNFKGVGKSNIARIFFFAGNVKITFESVRVDHTTSPALSIGLLSADS